MEEAAKDSVNGYSYFDNGDFDKSTKLDESDRSSAGSVSPRSAYRRKVGKRLVLHETDE